MKTYHDKNSFTGNARAAILYRKIAFLFVLLSFSFISLAQVNELMFTNPKLESGKSGNDGAIYRFPQVMTDVDALVRIVGRSSKQVKLENIDITNTGHQKAFQPQLSYNGGEVGKNTDWWMEFEISFVEKNKTTPVIVHEFDVTALDIDGYNNRLNEYVTFYNQKSFTLENNSLLTVTNLVQNVYGLLVPGKRFDGPKQDYPQIDTNATALMVTNKYEQVSTFRLRIGGYASANNSNAERMYSMYFKSFTYEDPTEFTLPLVLNYFNASLTSKNVALRWETGMEKELSHFVIERSTDGVVYKEAGIVFASGNSGVKLQYSFNDVLGGAGQGTLFYRLRMVDVGRKYQYSPVRIIKTNESFASVQMVVYPNPAVNEVRVTVPQSWQNKPVQYELYNTNGQLVKRVANRTASQTEVINVEELGAGMYVLRVAGAAGTGTQRIIKK